MSSSDLSDFIATDKHDCISVTVLVLNTDLFVFNKQTKSQPKVFSTNVLIS